jgi:hypothetical protein
MIKLAILGLILTLQGRLTMRLPGWSGLCRKRAGMPAYGGIMVTIALVVIFVLKTLGFMALVFGICFSIEFLDARHRMEMQELADRGRRSYVRNPDDDFDKSGPIDPVLDKLGYYDD